MRQIVTSDAFDREVLRSKRPTLVDFSAAWCGPCRAMLPLVENLADEFDGRVNVVKIDIDESPSIATRYHVDSIPTFIVFRDETVVQKLVGVQTRKAMEIVLESAIS